jgi:hypothetical protein
MDPSDFLKVLNNMRKDIEELTRNTEIRFIKRREQIKRDLKEVNDKSSRLEKLVLLLAVIQLIELFI